ncbi:hypothetical protein [Pseudomonas gingeri]|uniref:hypothetical protein n=1 Tax=Pseudomonas gingeri TaxID=117681 RepID=UPI0015A2755B|nr:hypothetical protein [Pseudomonas gingeri]NWA03712.1 hypothetical protein [Pseudomonas gingeri]NWA14571.1 hypothetical protein [Pseudomonas gingeri]NWA54811.1 hypothetical protein [Pseudomonas gingeri]NWA94535.1 hypothetical protein [Pseudomonas gingeri]NWB01191.1 hypothetical protein [Pseudomonas gingeri]
MMDVALALDLLVPAACRGGSLTSNTREQYETLRWEDDRPQPAWEELESAWAAQQPEIAREDFKETRRLAVAAIVVEVDGLLFDGNEISQSRMARAILSMDEEEETSWLLHDNTVASINRATLKAALRSAGIRQSELWFQPGKE